MNIQTIVKIISAVFGLLGVIFLFRIIGVEMKKSKWLPVWETLDSFSFSITCYCNFIITVVVTVLFSFLNLASSCTET